MKLAELRAVSVEIPRRAPRSRPTRTGANRSAARAFPINKYPEFSRLHGTMPGAVSQPFWVQAIAEDGTYGLGLGSWGAPVARLVDDLFAPLLEGRDCLATELANDLMWRAGQRMGPGGLLSVAQSAVDIALWDLKGKLLGKPVYELLGGPVRESIEVYCTSDDLDWSKELGFSSFKISNPSHHVDGQSGLDLIEERVALAREQVGASAELMFNPVMSFNTEYAVRVADRLRPYGLRWIEDPLMTWDLEGYVELRRRIGWASLAGGESHHGRHSFRQLLERRCLDIVQPDVRWCGGLSEMVKIHTLAEAFGIETIPHMGANTAFGQHFSIAMPNTPVAEYWMNSDPGVPLNELDNVPGVPVPVDGRVTPSSAPGFGLEIDPAWIRPAPYAAPHPPMGTP